MTYAPGELTAVARTGGEETGRFALRSATGPVALAVVADRAEIRADDDDLAYVAVTLQDADGTVVARRRPRGDGDRRGAGRAGRASAARRRRPRSPTSTTSHTTFDGRALAVVRPTGAGTITVTATADGCEPVSVTVEAR